ncbi:MAG: alpha/beta hydrolase, partial [Actinobacteria bacterium]|nr:alpha/beta hydrolase [Actinomycetota bacterium]
MRARQPDREGFVSRQGIRTRYEVFGDGNPTLLLMPPSPIAYSRIWKGQIHSLARHYRVVTFDGRGSGLSDRPTEIDEYRPQEFAADATAVLDHLDIQRAVLVSHCHAAIWALLLATQEPDRVSGWIAIAPGVPGLGKRNQHWEDMNDNWEMEPEAPTDWAMANKSFWRRGGYEEWMRFFFSQMFPEAHTTKQEEDAVGWATEVPVEVMIASESVDSGITAEQVEAMLSALEVPMLVIHGRLDGCQLVERGRAVAAITGARYLELDGVGHIPPGREPVKVNLAIKQFIDETQGVPMRTRTWTRALDRPKRALYVSSPIGLGHARRDVAVAQELKKLRPDLAVDWLAQDPVTRVLES